MRWYEMQVVVVDSGRREGKVNGASLYGQWRIIFSRLPASNASESDCGVVDIPSRRLQSTEDTGTTEYHVKLVRQNIPVTY